MVDVSLGGAQLVRGVNASTLTLGTTPPPSGMQGADPVYSLDGVPPQMGGSIAGRTKVLTIDLRDFESRLDSVSADIANRVNAQHLANNPANVRVLLREYAIERGPIISADGKDVAISQKTPNDNLKFLRTYPTAGLFSEISGYYSLVYGRGGLESTYNQQLTGQGGRLTMQQLSDQLLGQGQVGDSVVLTINSQLQQVATAALGSRKGAVVALDPATGAILALVSSPSYDPNPISSHDNAQSQAAGKGYQADPARPMLDRATSEAYPPGSTFKVVTAAAALQNGFPAATSFPPATQFLPGQTTSPIKNFGNENCGGDMTRAFTVSCNSYFAELGTKLPAGVLARTAQSFGFTTAPPLELPTSPSRLPKESDLKSPAFAAQSAIGQYNVAATPLQMALVAAAVANQGRIMQPTVVAEVRDPRGNVIQHSQPQLWKQAIDPATAATLTTFMESVVTSGTGTSAAIPGVQVAGKTGTAQTVVGQAPHAWFIAFAPVQAPKIAIAVLVENGGDLGSEATGGKVSAPIARQVMMADRAQRGW
ncbi:MAG: D,D-transpeptidase PbpA [Actinomycetota bacterium]